MHQICIRYASTWWFGKILGSEMPIRYATWRAGGSFVTSWRCSPGVQHCFGQIWHWRERDWADATTVIIHIMHRYIHTVHKNTYACTCIYIYIHMHTHTHICIYIYIHTYIYIYTCIYIYIYTCTEYMCIYTVIRMQLQSITYACRICSCVYKHINHRSKNWTRSLWQSGEKHRDEFSQEQTGYWGDEFTYL